MAEENVDPSIETPNQENLEARVKTMEEQMTSLCAEANEKLLELIELEKKILDLRSEMIALAEVNFDYCQPVPSARPIRRSS